MYIYIMQQKLFKILEEKDQQKYKKTARKI